MLSYETLVKFKNKIFSLVFNFLFSSSFQRYGKNNRIYWPDAIQGSHYISIDSNVVVRNGAWLLALKHGNIDPDLTIHSNTYIGRYSHIVSVRSVIIGSNVLIADKVYISDNIHEFNKINLPIKNQSILFKSAVTIHDGAWLGENVCIIGASVGKNAIVAANSVVTRDVPDYTVVAGAPAKVIKKYNHESSTWESV